MPRINMLPPDLKGPGGEQKRVFRYVAILLIIMVVLAYCSFLYRYFSMRDELAEIKARLEELAPRARMVEVMQKQGQEKQNKLNDLQDVLNSSVRWSNLLEEITGIIPGDIDLAGVSASTSAAASGKQKVPGVITIKGSSESARSTGILLQELKAMPNLDGVTINNLSEGGNKSKLNFSITARVKEVPAHVEPAK